MNTHRDRLPSIARRRIGAIVASVLLASCASKGPAPSYDDTHPRSVAIIPVLPSEYLTIDRHSLVGPLFGMVGIAVERTDRGFKQAAFEDQYGKSRKEVADTVTVALLDAARRRGFEATVLTGIVRTPDDPEEFDYRRIPTDADVIIHVRIKDMGVFNKTLELDYQPQVDLATVLAVRRTGDELLNENFHYGANATRDEFWAVAADERYRFTDYDAVMAESKLLRESWQVGARALADRIVGQLKPPSSH